jgi:hypothetical protein
MLQVKLMEQAEQQPKMHRYLTAMHLVVAMVVDQV